MWGFEVSSPPYDVGNFGWIIGIDVLGFEMSPPICGCLVILLGFEVSPPVCGHWVVLGF